MVYDVSKSLRPPESVTFPGVTFYLVTVDGMAAHRSASMDWIEFRYTSNDFYHPRDPGGPRDSREVMEHTEFIVVGYPSEQLPAEGDLDAEEQFENRMSTDVRKQMQPAYDRYVRIAKRMMEFL